MANVNTKAAPVRALKFENLDALASDVEAIRGAGCCEVDAPGAGGC